MLDGNALPQPPTHRPNQSLAGRAFSSPQALQAALIVLGVALVTFVLFLYVLPNSQMDAAKVRIAELQARKAMLERENAALLQQIASASDLKTLEVRAAALGMGPTRNAIYLRLPGSAPAAEVRPDAAEEQVGDAGPATLAEWLQRENLQEILRNVRLSVSQAVDQIIQRFQTN